MAEGGYHFENPTFDEDKIIDEIQSVLDYEENMHANEEFNRSIQNQSAHIEDINDVDTRTQLINEQKQSFVNEYYKLIKEKYGLNPVHIDITNFELGPDNKTLLLKVGDRDIQLSKGTGFISLSTLASRIGSGGTSAIRDLLSLPNYSSATKSLSAQAVANLQKLENNLPNIDNVEITDLPNAAETAVKEIETSFADWNEREEVGTQTDMTKREMDGILKAMTSVKEEIANELSKLNETNKELAKERDKLEQAKADGDEFQIDRLNSRIKDLEAERSARLEVINVNRDKLRSQVSRIKDTINKVLKEDTTLGERIRTLFREQGITIVSILTAFGMIIGVIVEAVIPSGGAVSSPPPPKNNEGGAKDWIKKQLSNLGKLLANLAGKVSAALPGIIGSIVSWLLSSAGKVASWFGDHLWALVVLVAGLLYAAAKEYINKSRK